MLTQLHHHKRTVVTLAERFLLHLDMYCILKQRKKKPNFSNKEKRNLIHIYAQYTVRINNNNLVQEISCYKTIYE